MTEKNNLKRFDIIVIGGGHAGIEAALISAKLGNKVGLITLEKKKIGFMPCNPSVGGSAKGIVVREIDALGGEMGRAADATAQGGGLGVDREVARGCGDVPGVVF